MTFKEYIKQRQVRDNLAGDFTKDARADAKMPDVRTWSELRWYLERGASRDARADVVSAARTVWQGYQAKLRTLRQQATS
ncbi:hypothetical protein GCM10007420_14640 [Glycocaulis albus]|uniref:YozE SAM-like domain-containing protein n=1 Tax=Glycocaulis albus TaxID=1382801 RepID=A0ABQ1XPQ6_9PROT|nr:hypothetical protein GCM10007420_14640 [Glycocaulis albus]